MGCQLLDFWNLSECESERASARYVCERERERQLVHRECKGEQVPGV